MKDDTERRLRDALHADSLPDAPETLRASMRAIATGAPPAASRARRPWLRALPALAAVVVVALAAGALSGGFGRLGGPSTSAVATSAPSGLLTTAPSEGTSGTPIPSGTPVPPPAARATSVKPLDADALTTAIREVQGGVVGAHDVVVSVGADSTRRPAPAVRECADPLGTCTVVGVLPGLGDTLGVITVRSERLVLPPPTTAADLAAPLALRLVPGGPIELLGHVDLVGGSGALDAAGLKGRTATTVAGHVVAALAWLQSVQLPSCGPAMPDDVPNPFQCPGEPSFLTDEPVQAASVDEHPSAQPGSSIAPNLSVTTRIPDSAVRVQAFAYGEFAPSPVTDGINTPSRQGMYLVRMVAVDNADCRACRGWLVVGRLDANAPEAASAVPNAGVPIYSAAEIAARLTSDRTAWIGKAVLVDGSIDTSIRPSCALGASACTIGRLAGTTELVSATTYTGQLLRGGFDLTVQGVMAIAVRGYGLEYLGEMGSAGGADFQATVADLASTAANPPSGPLTFIVSAWLGTSGPLPCMSAPGSPPPADTPFGSGCPSSWLAPTDKQAGYAMPEGGVRVQFSAYQDFAPGASDLSGPPRYGTYLVRLVTDTRQGLDGPRGWQVVARLAP